MSSVLPTAATAIAPALQRAAAATGADFSALLATAGRESAFDPAARAKTSSASGLFQFIESTWLEMIARHGAKHGLAREAALIERAGIADPAARQAILDLRFDPEIAAKMAGELTQQNAASLKSALGRPASPGELYAAHVLGAGGAAKLIGAAQRGEADASALFPEAAKANAGLFYDRDGAPRSAQALLAKLTDLPGVNLPKAELAAASAPLSPALIEALFAALPAGLLSEGADDRPAPERAALRAAAYGAALKR